MGMWTGKSDYDEWGRFVFTVLASMLITLPIWILPYGIWYAVKGRKEEQILKEEQIKNDLKRKEWIKANPPQIKQPILFSSISEKNSWIKRNM